jgi:hypothetical protein
MNQNEKFLDISKRMDAIVSYESRKPWRRRYGSEEQYAEEFPEEDKLAIIAAFQLIKIEYEEIRDYVLADGSHKLNTNTVVLERILEDDIEGLLLGQNRNNNDEEEGLHE